MLPDRVSNPGPLTYESGALPIALRGPARCFEQLGPGVLVKVAEEAISHAVLYNDRSCWKPSFGYIWKQ